MISMVVALAALGLAADEGTVRRVETVEALQEALRTAGPGTVVAIAPGTYRGGLSARGLRGTADRPVTIRAADPAHPPVFRGGAGAFHLSDAAHLVVSDLIIEQMSGNGLNLDDGGTAETPAHHVALRRLVVRDVGPRGNIDGIKLSGVDDLTVDGCTIERWGSGGSGIDMVGCHRVEVVGCTFRHADDRGDNGVQAKGGSSQITIRGCRFEHAGQRAVNLGGSTGMPYFRPKPQGYEAKDVTVEDCTIVGGQAAVAFVGVDGATVRRNTIVHPRRWVVRILQETRAPGFVPCRNGVIAGNLIVFRAGELSTPVNIGDATAPETFQLAGNAWYADDAPARSRPRLDPPLREADGIYGVAPRFINPDQGDYQFPPDDRLRDVGARAARSR